MIRSWRKRKRVATGSNGGYGNRTYRFGCGDGQDVISSYEVDAGKRDVPQFKEGGAATGVTVSRWWGSLALEFGGPQGRLTL